MSFEFEKKLEQYAEVIVKIGLNVQPGQRLLIGAPIFADNYAPIELAPLVRLITKKSYQVGAKFVEVMWIDPQLRLYRYKFAPRDSFVEFPKWRTDLVRQYAENGDAILVIYAEDPDLLSEQDPNLVNITQQTFFKYLEPIMDLVVKNATNWAVISAPVQGWGDKVFPDLPAEKRNDKFWDTLFDICRIKGVDPVAKWQEHIKNLSIVSEYLNKKQYDALKFIASGTDLKIKLPKGHKWCSGSMTSQNGIKFTANIPTEEVFTIPHRDKTEGIVTATKPLYYGGRLVEDYKLKFSNGHIIEATARKGGDFLQSLIKIDKGASRIGEVALIPYSSPISQSGLLFYNILIDENASNHIALGRAYKFSLEKGETLSDEEFKKRGGNHSLIHIDCMIGSSEMNVDGILDDGKIEPIMRNGEWAFNI